MALSVVPDWRRGILEIRASSQGSVCFVDVRTSTLRSNDLGSSKNGTGNAVLGIPERVTYVVKASSRVVQELYACCAIKSLGIPCAAIRVVNSDQGEWGDIKTGIKNYISGLSDNNEVKVQLQNLLAGPLDRAQLMVMEYIPGISLDSFYSLKEGAKFRVQENLFIVGRLLVADVLLNNSDRVPSPAWMSSNEGNAGNLMVDQSTGLFIAIDSLVTTINPENPVSKKYFDGRLRYIESFLNDLVDLASDFDQKVSSSEIIKQVGNFLKTFIGNSLSLDSGSWKSFVDGLVCGLRAVCYFLESKWQESLHRHIKGMFSYSWMNGWAEGVNLIHLSYFEGVGGLFMHALQNAADLNIFENEAMKVKIKEVQRRMKLFLPPKVNQDTPRLRGSDVAEPMDDDVTSVPIPTNDNNDMKREPKKTFFSLNADVFNTRKQALSKVDTKVTTLASVISEPKSVVFPASKINSASKSLANPVQGLRLNPSALLGARKQLAVHAIVPKESALMMEAKAKQSGATISLEKDTLMNKVKESNFIESECLKYADDLDKDARARVFKLLDTWSLKDANDFINFRDYDLLFFDFDQTLTTSEFSQPMPGSKEKPKTGVHLRGGHSTLQALQDLKNKNLFIVTANAPSKVAAKSVGTEVSHLKLDSIFKCMNSISTGQVKVLREDEDLASLSLTNLTAKLMMAIILSSNRTGEDMHRISSASFVLGSPESHKIAFRLFQATENDQYDLDTLSAEIVIENSLVFSYSAEYAKRVKPEMRLNTLFIYTDDAGEIRALGKADILKLLTDVMNDEDFRIKHRILYGECVEFGTTLPGSKQKVDLAACGNIICSKYNKAEAIHFILSKALLSKHQNLLRNDDFDLLVERRKIVRCLFVDDSCENVYSVFNYFSSKKEELAELFDCRIVVDCAWFTPPVSGYHEAMSSQMIQSLVDRFSAITLRELLPKQRQLLQGSPTVFCIQDTPLSIAKTAMKVDQALQKLPQRVDFVLLPEGFLLDTIDSSIDSKTLENEKFKPLCEVARKHQVYIVAGTILESAHGENMFYTTALFISDDGAILGIYRKQRIHDFQVQKPGDSLGVFDTKFGKVGVLICLDIEDKDLLMQTINAGAQIIFNPVHIPLKLQDPSNCLAAWRTKLQSMQRYLEKICVERNVSVIRCDIPWRNGSGTSQVITPAATATIAGPGIECLTFDLSSGSSSLGKNLFSEVPTKSYSRSDDVENIGFRLRCQNLHFDDITSEVTNIAIHIDDKTKQKGLKLVTTKGEAFFLNLSTLKTSSQGAIPPEDIKRTDFNAVYASKTHLLTMINNDLVLVNVQSPVNDGHIIEYKFPASEKVSAFCLDLDNLNIYAALVGSPGSIVAWSFSHNNIPAALGEFLSNK